MAHTSPPPYFLHCLSSISTNMYYVGPLSCKVFLLHPQSVPKTWTLTRGHLPFPTHLDALRPGFFRGFGVSVLYHFHTLRRWCFLLFEVCKGMFNIKVWNNQPSKYFTFPQLAWRRFKTIFEGLQKAGDSPWADLGRHHGGFRSNFYSDSCTAVMGFICCRDVPYIIANVGHLLAWISLSSCWRTC